MGRKIDPTVTCANRIVGKFLGEIEEIPDAFVDLEVYLLIY